ncbi:hypothetical protein [Agromyces sp. Root81]|nr:hypothetical protein [Agromyces sp. Root81]
MRAGPRGPPETDRLTARAAFKYGRSCVKPALVQATLPLIGFVLFAFA